MNQILSLLFKSGALLLLCAACAGQEHQRSSSTVTIQVTAFLAGISSEETETSLTVPLEQVLAKIPSLYEMRSRSAHGQSTIWLELKEPHENIALQLVQNFVTKAQASLPATALRPVVVLSISPWKR